MPTSPSILRRLGPVGLMSILAAVLPAVGILFILGLIHSLAPWLRSHGLLGILLYVTLFWLIGGLALLPTWVHSLLGGFTFGFALGLPLSMLAFLGASLVAYTLSRFAAGQGVTQLISEKPKWQAVYNALLASGFWRSFSIITLLRLAASPFAVTNVIMAAVRARPLPFALSIIGMAPRTAFMVFTGAIFKGKSFAELLSTTREPKQFWLLLLSLSASAAVIALIGLMAKRAIDRVTTPKP